MRFVSLVNGLVAKARRGVSQGLSIGESTATEDGGKPDPAKLTEQLRQVMLRVNKLEAAAGSEATEFETVCGTSGATVELVHNFKGPVRWWVTKWIQTDGVTYPVTNSALVEDATSTASVLVLRSYAAGRAVVRVEPSQSIVDPGLTVVAVSMPLVASFTKVLAGGRAATTTDDNGGILVTTTNSISGLDYRILKKSQPSTPYVHTVKVSAAYLSDNTNQPGAGICFRESSTGNCQFFGIHQTNGIVYLLIRNTTASDATVAPATFAFVADNTPVVSFPQALLGSGLWLRQTNDGANKTWKYSTDGLHFVQLATVGLASFLLPDEIGLWSGDTAALGTGSDVTAFFTEWVIT